MTDRELVREIMNRLGHGKKQEGCAGQYSREWEEHKDKILYRGDTGDVCFYFQNLESGDGGKLTDIGE